MSGQGTLLAVEIERQPATRRNSLRLFRKVRSLPLLRVITRKWGNTFRLELFGLLGGDWVPLLEQHWRAIVHHQPSAKVTVVLSDVDFIDSHGERLLRRMAASGVRFEASGCMNRHLVETLEPYAGETKGVGHEGAGS